MDNFVSLTDQVNQKHNYNVTLKIYKMNGSYRIPSSDTCSLCHMKGEIQGKIH